MWCALHFNHFPLLFLAHCFLSVAMISKSRDLCADLCKIMMPLSPWCPRSFSIDWLMNRLLRLVLLFLIFLGLQCVCSCIIMDSLKLFAHLHRALSPDLPAFLVHLVEFTYLPPLSRVFVPCAWDNEWLSHELIGGVLRISDLSGVLLAARDLIWAFPALIYAVASVKGQLWCSQMIGE